MSLLQNQLLSFFILFFFFLSSSYCNTIQDPRPLSNYLDHETSGYDNQAYPTFFGFFDDDHSNDGELSSLIEYQHETIGWEKLDKVGSPSSSLSVFNVDDFGAKGDGSDDTQAFGKAWKAACSTAGGAVLVVPKDKNYLLKPIIFSGPCMSDITLQILGTIEASNDRSDYQKDQRHWIIFQKINNFIVEGGGVIDGQGDIWWKNSCKINKALPCVHAPTALTFLDCQNLKVRNIKIQNGQQMNLAFQKCVNVQALNLMVTAPGKSPNTDGIHVTGTENILIKGCVIKTGDDCISIVSGSQKVQAIDITCGPGHGISIGSLGAGGSEAHVSDVFVDTARFSGTTNGVRIKTWQGGSGSAQNIIFQNISMNNVSNPIIIDQNYCDQKDPCQKEGSAVQVQNVVYRNIQGTSASKTAIKFDCSESYPCSGILLQNVNLVGEEEDEKVTAMCNNVKWNQKGSVSPGCP